MLQSEALWMLLLECERTGFSVELEYDNGKRIPGKYLDLPEDEQKQHIEQGPKGWTIEIGGYYAFESVKDFKQVLYPTLDKAISGGANILADLLNRRGEKSPLLRKWGIQ